MILTAGQPVGNGLSEKAAKELGLVEGTPVGSAVIDAYAGWIGTVGATTPEDAPREGRLALKESGHRLAAVAGELPGLEPATANLSDLVNACRNIDLPPGPE